MATDLSALAGTGALAGILAFIAGMIVFVIILGVILWIYLSLAFTAIGKKAKLSSPGIAWIPGVGPLIIAFRTSKMHWWPWLLLLSVFIGLVPIVGQVIYFAAIIVFSVYSIIWQWKMFEAIDKPGWWAILPVIPIIGSIAYLVVAGMAAWGK